MRNYAALLVAVTECWEQEHFPEDRVIRLIGTLLGSFIRTERSRGYLVSLSEDECHRVLSRLTPEARTPAPPSSTVRCARLRSGRTTCSSGSQRSMRASSLTSST